MPSPSSTPPEPRGAPPPPGTVEAWCWDLVRAESLAAKLAPPAPPDPALDASWEPGEGANAPPPRRLLLPGRPAEFQLVDRSPKTPRPGALVRREARARLLHTFLHHELQAAELFCWAILAFPATPRAFRRGLLRICLEELDHLAGYRAHLAALGCEVGAYPVRDWFWERGITCPSPVAFVAFVGLGLEGANLDHSARFAEAFRGVGDLAGAELLERVGREEVGHVAFAVRWFRELTGADALDYDRWAGSLPAPLTPTVFRGKPLERAARARAGMDEEFLRRLEGS